MVHISVSAVDLTDSGTSFAAPAVAGIIELIQNNNSTLRIQPEGCRAILLGGARLYIVENIW
jgi:subtilisin family serine protease